jgi:DNA-binding transcriptional MerR regulator
MNTTRDLPKKSQLVRLAEAARAAGVGKQTLEYYILLGLVKPRRKPGRRGRYFDRALIRRIHLIHSLNQSGYTLRDIRETFLSR